MLVSAVFLLALNLVQGRVRVGPLVQTSQGPIRGLQADDGDYPMFLGIPFGKVQEDNPFGVRIPLFDFYSLCHDTYYLYLLFFTCCSS